MKAADHANPSTVDPRIAAGADYGVSDGEWRRVDWRSRRRSVEVDGARVSFVELGEGDPILFVHGLSGCWQNWLENLPHFGATHRVVALDLPGFGASPMPPWKIDIPAYGRLVRGFCEELGLPDATLVGNSMGGFIAAEAVTLWPDAFRRLVLVSAAGILNAWNAEAGAAATAWAWRRFGERAADRGMRLLARPRTREALLGRVMRYPNRLPADLLWEQVESGQGSPGFGDALRAVVSHDLRDRLGAITAPTMVLSGLDDRLVPIGAALSYHRRIPGSRLEVFERTGHVPQLERPLRFNAILADFLART